jgi:hypothetical protein
MLPGVNDDVVIDVPRTDMVMSDLQFVAIHSLSSQKALAIRASGPSGVFSVATTAVVNNDLTLVDQGFAIGGQLTVSGQLTWTATNSSSIDGSGRVSANGGMTIDGYGNHILSGGCTLDNAATATWAAGYIPVRQGATWNNLSGSTLVIQSSQYFGESAGTFNNAGTVRKLASDPTEFVAAFQNTGTVEVAQGRRLILSGVGNSSGAFNVAGTLEFRGSLQVLQPGSQVSGAGDVLFSGGTSYLFGSYNVTGTTTLTGYFTTVNFMSDATLGQLRLDAQLSGGKLGGTGTVTVTGLLDWTEGTMGGPGRTVARGTVALNSNNLFGGPGLDGRTFDNMGVATWTGGGRMAASNGAVWNNLAGATLDARSDIGFFLFGAAPSVFNNAGTLRKSFSPNTTFLGLTLHNTGVVDIQSGTLSLGGGGNADGQFTVAADAVLDLNANPHAFTLNPSSQVMGAGSVRLEGGIVAVAGSITVSGTTQVISGTANFASDVTLAALTLSGGVGTTLTGSGTVTVTGLLSWMGGRMSGPGRTVASGGLAISGNDPKYLDGRTLDNAGMATLTGTGFPSTNGAIWNNLAGATFDVRTDLTLSASSSTFNNAGTFRKSAGSGMAFIGLAFYNTGTVDVQSGELSLAGGGVSSGQFLAEDMTVLEFRTGDPSTHTLTADSQVTGPGTVRFFRGTTHILGSYDVSVNTVINGGDADFISSVRTRQLTLSENGTLEGYGDVTVTERLDWVSGTMRGPGHTVTSRTMVISGPIESAKLLDGRTIDNSGTITWMASNIYGSNGAVWNNLQGALFDVQSDRVLSDASFNNAGTFRKSFGNGTTRMVAVFNNDGTVVVQAGTLALAGGGRSTGTFNIDYAMATVSFGPVTYVLSTGTMITGDGLASVNQSFFGLLVDDVVTVANFESDYAGLIILSTGHLVITHTFIWTSDSIIGEGSVDIASTATLNINGNMGKAISGLTINNAGTTVWSGTGDILASQVAVFNNLAGAVFNIVNNQRFDLAVGEPPCSSVFNNAGVFQKTAGGGTTTIGLRFNNTGTVDIRSGTVDFRCGTSGPVSASRTGELVTRDPVALTRGQAHIITTALVPLSREGSLILREDAQRPDDARAPIDAAPIAILRLVHSLDDTIAKLHRDHTEDSYDGPLSDFAVKAYFRLFNCDEQSWAEKEELRALLVR